MSILVNRDTRVICQGITGKVGEFHTRGCLDYGTRMVGGVTPGKGGETVAGLPVFDTVAEARDATGANATMIFVPPAFAADAILEAVDAGIELVIAITEGIPVLDMARVMPVVKASQSRLVGPQATVGIEGLGEDQFGRLLGHLLDVHAARGAGDEHGRAGPPVDENGTVEFAIDRAAALDEHLPHHLPLGAGLDGDERVVEQARGDPLGIGGGLGKLHAALLAALDPAFAAAAGMDLGLDGADGRAERGEGGGGFGGRAGNLPSEHGHAGGPEQILGLVFVNLHGAPFVAAGLEQYGRKWDGPKGPRAMAESGTCCTPPPG